MSSPRKPTKKVPKPPPLHIPFDVDKYLETAGIQRKIVGFQKGQPIFTQGDQCQSVFYIRSGSVRISVNSSEGKEAVIGALHAGDFCGEGCIAGQPLRVSTATALDAVLVLEIDAQEMIRVLHEEKTFSDRFVAHMLKRNVRIEEDLVDQLFNSSEKRLARALLLMARYGTVSRTEKVVAHVSQDTLAKMIGTTRSRVSFFMNKFRRLGFVEYNGGDLHINDSLLRVILHD
jgi:CRP/FNR family transcriptional regulator, cyclic AMP receptor protein